MNAESQVIVISGGSRGLGRAIVTDLMQHGHVVATFSRSSTAFIEECQNKDPAGKHFYWESVDGTDAARVKGFVTAVARRYGRIDTVINNAAMLVTSVFPMMRESDIHETIALNLEGAIHLTHACSRVMLQHKSGNIINISSLNGVRGHAGVSIYSATKAALDGLTRSLARELGPYGICVNSVAPGYFQSEMSADFAENNGDQVVRRTPLRRLGSVEDLVGVVRFFISPESRFITGQTLVVDGGYTC